MMLHTRLPGIARGARRAALAALLLAPLGALAPGVAPAVPPGMETGRLLLKVRPGADTGETLDEIARHGGRVVDRVDELNILVAEIPPGQAHAAKNALKRSPRFKFVEPEALHEPTYVPNDPLIGNEWHLTKLELFAAWDLITGSPSVPIAILDSGVDPSHPDLAGKLVPGWNCYSNDADTSDVYGHGTQVAGSAAAAGNNGIGVAGPALLNPIMPIRVTGTNGWASDSAIVKGLTWAADHGARVANLSFAGIHTSSSIQTAAQYFMSRGGLVTASAGNYNTDDGSNDTPYVISVSATAGDDTRATWSSFGRYVDVAAPGVGIYTTSRGGGYSSASGTSFSAPVTAGVIGLIQAANPSLTPQQVEGFLEANADDKGSPGFDIYFGNGRVNARRAVAAAEGTGAPPPDTSVPAAAVVSPASGSTLSGQVVVSATASDNVAIQEVRFYVDGQMIASDPASPYSAAWNTDATNDGSHVLVVDAYDTSGNRGTSPTVPVVVSNAAPSIDTEPPSEVTLTAPSTGQTLSGSVTIAASAVDNTGVARVDFLVDSVVVASDASAPFQAAWNSAAVPDGPHVLTVDAYDANGSWATSAPVTVTTANASPDTTPPTVTITSPIAGATLGTKLSVIADAHDSSGIARVDFYVDGVLKATRTIAPYTYTTNAKKLSAGTHVVAATAVDTQGLSATASISVMRPLSFKRVKAKKQP
jgi:subtilisin family serine protease